MPLMQRSERGSLSASDIYRASKLTLFVVIPEISTCPI
jgi:hypothetical protein